MHRTPASDRRSFLKSSALVAAPLAAVAVPVAAGAADDSAARLARIEDERAIEALHREFLRAGGGEALRGTAKHGGTIRSIEPDHQADPAPIEFADDGDRATARHKCTVQLASHHAGDTTLEQMARLQGNAADVRTKRCVILAHYHKQGGRWSLASAEFA